MTSGGSAERTTTVVCFIYLAAFEFYEFGYVSTLLPTFAGSGSPPC
jgi:multiple sugar transport system permease protein